MALTSFDNLTFAIRSELVESGRFESQVVFVDDAGLELVFICKHRQGDAWSTSVVRTRRPDGGREDERLTVADVVERFETDFPGHPDNRASKRGH